MTRYQVSGLALLLLLGLATLLALPAGAAETADAQKIGKLVEKLGSDDFSEREKAAADLDTIGDPALPALRKAVQGNDVEISRRCADLLAKIEKRGETARILAPKKVHLVYRDTPVADAITDFAKKSGYPIVLNDPEGKLKDRTISLDTGEVSFWRAFDLFCARAGLVEVDAPQIGAFHGGIHTRPIQRVPPNIQPVPPQAVPLPAQPPKEEESRRPGNPGAVAQIAVAFAQAQPPPPPQPAPPVRAQIAVATATIGGWNAVGQNQIVVTDGNVKALPTDDASAVRVRVMESTEMFGPAAEKEILLGLKVTAEPKLAIQRILNVRVDKATDDQGQTLAQALANAAPNAPAAIPQFVHARMFVGGLTQYTPVRLTKGEKESKSLKELTGVISTQLLTPATPAIVADKIMDAAGKEFKGAEGGRIKVNEVSKDANGKITVKFELEQPPNMVADAPAAWPRVAPAVPVRPVPAPPAKPAAPGAAAPVPQPAPAGPAPGRPGVVVGRAAGPMIAAPINVNWYTNGISLEDQKGNPIRVAGMNTIIRAGAGIMVREQSLDFAPEKDQVPARLVFSGRRSVTIDVPFSLKDVKLP